MRKIRGSVAAGVVLTALWVLAWPHPSRGGGRPIEPPTSAPTPTVVRIPGPARALVIEAFRVHPDGLLYAGDRLSFEVQIRNAGSIPLPGARVEIRRRDPDGEEILAEALLPELEPGASAPAVWTWVWEAPTPGPLTLIAVAQPVGDGARGGDRITRTISLLPREMLPEVERRARWAQAESRCCTHYYLTGTVAEADLLRRMAWADEAEVTVRARLGLPAPLPTAIVWIPRLLGHGGFALGDSMVLTDPLVDRLPADLPTILRHEWTHRLTCAWVGREDCLVHLPSMVTEGLAVFVAGGHYRPEPLTWRAAALLHRGGWIPLDRLAQDFYRHPHEIGYLEAGAWIEELFREGGWPRLRAFFQAIERRPGESDLEALDRALQAVYHQDIRTFEGRWQARLRALPVDPEQIADLEFTIAFYETLRAYQRAYDPSAYFLGTWLPDWRRAVREGIVADFIREPAHPEGQRFWQALQEARRRAAEGDPQGARSLLSVLCRALACAEALPP